MQHVQLRPRGVEVGAIIQVFPVRRFFKPERPSVCISHRVFMLTLAAEIEEGGNSHVGWNPIVKRCYTQNQNDILFIAVYSTCRSAWHVFGS